MECMGVASGCDCKEVLYIDFLILLISTPFVSVRFCSSIFKNVFRSCRLMCLHIDELCEWVLHAVYLMNRYPVHPSRPG